VDFSKCFSGGAKVVKFGIETEKTAFFADIFKFLLPSDTHACV